MKKKYLLILLLLSSITFASDIYKIPVLDMTDGDMEGTWNLEHDSNLGRTVLDCQSFLHGIYIHERDEKKFFYLYEPECHEIYDFVSEGVQKDKFSCVQLNFASSEFYLSREEESCD